MTPHGCEMGEDIATDQGLLDFVDEYLRGVYLRNLTSSPEIYLETIERLGIRDDTELLLALEAIVKEAGEKAKESNE